MLRDHFDHHRRQHRRTIIGIGLFVLFAGCIGIAGVFGMRPAGIGFLAALFLIVGLLMEAAADHN